MAYKSKEKFPLLNNPAKQTYCTVDPNRGTPCRVHFHRDTLKHLTPLNIDLPNTVDGYDHIALVTEKVLTVEELQRIEIFPARKDIPPVATEENEVLSAFNNKDSRASMDSDVQVVAAVTQAKATIRKLESSNLRVNDLERKIVTNGGKRDDGSPESLEYYKAVDSRNKIMVEQAKNYYVAASQMGLNEKHPDDKVRWLAANQPEFPFNVQNGYDGLTVADWTPEMKTLMYTVDTYAGKEHVQAKWEEEKSTHSEHVKRQNEMLKETGTNFRYTPVRPSKELVYARIEAAIQNKEVREAQDAVNSANIFNRKSRVKHLDEAKNRLWVAQEKLDNLEG